MFGKAEMPVKRQLFWQGVKILKCGGHLPDAGELALLILLCVNQMHNPQKLAELINNSILGFIREFLVIYYLGLIGFYCNLRLT